MLLLLAIAWSAPCAPATTAALNEGLTKAEIAFGRRDETSVARWSGEVRALLPCLTSPVAPVDVARMYTVFGLNAYLVSDRDAAQRWFEAARGARPEQPFPDVGLPAEHELPVLYDGVTTVQPGAMALPPPREGWLLVDGEPATEAPIGRSWLFQRANGTGEIVQTALLSPADPLAAYLRRRRPWMALQGGLWHYPNASDVRLLSATTLTLGVPMATRIDASAQVSVGWYDVGLLPALQIGGRAWILEGDLAPWAGAGVEATLHEDGGSVDDGVRTVIRPALAVPIGLRISTGTFAVDLDLTSTLGTAHDGEGLRLGTRATAGIALTL